MNVLMLLKPKSEVEYLVDKNTLRRGIEKMYANSYAALPVLSKEGLYIGSVSEGDFLKYIIDGQFNIKNLESKKIADIVRPEYNPAVSVNVSMETLIERSENQNFIPVTDDRGYFIGIVTRGRIIETFCRTDSTVFMQTAARTV